MRSLLRALVVSVVCISLCQLSQADPAPVECAPWVSDELCIHQSQDGVDSFTIACLPDHVGAVRSSFFYYHGVFSAAIKLHEGDSGGTCTAFYLISSESESNEDADHFEIDVELFGGDNGTDAILATNVFFGGKQNLAQFRLPFDAAADYHTYAMTWNHQNVTWLVDGAPIRILTRTSDKPWPQQALQPIMSQWEVNFGDQRANFSEGPIPAFARNLSFSGCRYQSPDPSTWGDWSACPTWTGTDLAWNVPIPSDQLADLETTSYGWADNNTRINDWGWDKA